MADITLVAALTAIAGGVLVGGAAVLLLAANGRIAGISGILGGLLWPQPGEVAWRLLFVAGLVAGGLVLEAVQPGAIGPAMVGAPLLVAGGLLVGFGTRLGSGCTSGHGVCGVGRLSPRSTIATVTFVVAGIATTYLVRHVLGGAS